jgi:hypothetical protein
MLQYGAFGCVGTSHTARHYPQERTRAHVPIRGALAASSAPLRVTATDAAAAPRLPSNYFAKVKYDFRKKN